MPNSVLWAPWRWDYIRRPESARTSSDPSGTGDLFLDLPAANDDAANFILHRGTQAFMLLNAFPYASGHLMIAPYRQVAEIDQMTDAELLEVQQLVAESVRWIRHAYRPDGFNIGVNMGSAAGAGIPKHIHWHVVPRWNGDANFMTTIAEVRVVPQLLPETYATLVAARDAVGPRLAVQPGP
ncbi:MAG: HIT domain-containing protein [Fimbriimonadaceae bacterium]|nr:HIT domain-containing protein [Fimbriimonadaceae bacterium]